MMDTIQKAFEMAGGSEGLSALFLTGLIALWYRKFDRKAETGYLFWYSFIALLVVINPLYYWIIVRFSPELQQNNMMLWILPTTPVIMYVCVSATSFVKKKVDKIVFGLAMVVILILAGTTSYTGTGHGIVPNAYYIPDEEYEMIVLVEQYLEGSKRETIMLWGDQEIMQYARIYDGAINVLYGKDLWLGTQDSQLHQIYEESLLDAYRKIEHAPYFLKEIGEIANEHSCDVLVMTREDFALSGIAIPETISDSYTQYTATDKYIMYVRMN